MNEFQVVTVLDKIWSNLITDKRRIRRIRRLKPDSSQRVYSLSESILLLVLLLSITSVRTSLSPSIVRQFRMDCYLITASLALEEELSNPSD